jgi:four helix bundle protein
MGRFGNGDLPLRTEQYGLRAIKLFQHLRKSKDEHAWIIGRQYSRAATSIGANLVEADAAETRKDFIHKCGISLKEARECRYWLRLSKLASLVNDNQVAPLLGETEEVIAVLVSIIVKAKKNLKDKR